jgi:hypothetical protein
MDLRRLRGGEWILALSGAALLTSLFLPWYKRGDADLTGWEAMSVLDVVLALVAVAAMACVLVTATQETAAVSISLESVTTLLGLVGSVVALVRVIDMPDLGPGFGAAVGAYIGLAGALGVAAGGLIAIRDERLPTAPRVEIEAQPPPRGHAS